MSFIAASQARKFATVNADVLSEIHAIEDAVLASVNAGTFSSTVDGSTMTSTEAGAPRELAEIYYNVWRSFVSDKSKEANMISVIDHFTDLGYGIKRMVNPVTNSTFIWYVSW